MDWDSLVAEAKALIRAEKGRVWVPGYTRDDGTFVHGYYRFQGVIGATAFRPDDTFEGFFDTPKAKGFEKLLGEAASKHNVKLDKVERVMGYWQGHLEPSWSIEAHDGEEGVRNFSEEIRGKYDQDAVLNFDYDEQGDSVMYVLDGEADWPKELEREGIEGATVFNNRVEIIGDDALAEKVAKIKEKTGADASAYRGSLSLIDRVQSDT
jgi:hypothetical protein